MKKINFSDRYGLTKAVLDGRKTQTRRICKEQHWSFSDLVNANENDSFLFEQPKYRKGEVVAVAQSYKDVVEHLAKKGWDIARWLDKHGVTKNMAGWLNKMFVKVGLMIYYIRITNVRVERLNDISEADCIAEGIRDYSTSNEQRYGFPDFKREDIHCRWSPREAYAALIDKISGKGTWDSNPWVFVYEFELVD